MIGAVIPAAIAAKIPAVIAAKIPAAIAAKIPAVIAAMIPAAIAAKIKDTFNGTPADFRCGNQATRSIITLNDETINCHKVKSATIQI